MAQTTIQVSTDTTVKAVGGRVNWIQITALGATAGNVWSLKDGGAGGSEKVRGVIEVANGAWIFHYVDRNGDPGIVFANDIYYSENALAGTVYATIGYE